MAPPSTDIDAVMALIAQVSQPCHRILLAIAGPPGSGKSTLAEEVVARLNSEAAIGVPATLVPMDGFHLDNEALIALEMLARKGAPETFDAFGLLRLVRNVKKGGADIRYPLFDRSRDRSLKDAGLLQEQTSIVVIEGNYLLLDTSPWHQLAELFDATVFLSPPIETLERRLMDRWLGYAYSAELAAEKVQDNDLRNARFILENSRTADLVLPHASEVDDHALPTLAVGEVSDDTWHVSPAADQGG